MSFILFLLGVSLVVLGFFFLSTSTPKGILTIMFGTVIVIFGLDTAR